MASRRWQMDWQKMSRDQKIEHLAIMLERLAWHVHSETYGHRKHDIMVGIEQNIRNGYCMQYWGPALDCG